MDLKKWLNLTIKKNLIQAFKRLLIVALPILAVVIYYVTQSKLTNIIENNKYNLIIGLKTGDKTLIAKSISLLSQTSLVIEYQLTDQNNNIIIKSEEKKDYTTYFYKLKFITDIDLNDENLLNWGTVQLVWAYDFYLLFIILVVTIAVFLATHYLIKVSLNDLTHKLSANFSTLSVQVDQESPSELFITVTELQSVYKELINSKHNMLENELNKNKLRNKENLFQLSQKLAHDIRSPVSTLNLISSKIEDAEIKSLQLAVVAQINAIANGLLNENKANTKETAASLSSNLTTNFKKQSLYKIFKTLKSEYVFKKISIQQNVIFDIEQVINQDIFVAAEIATIIYRSVNNFIQNAIEATPLDGTITVQIIKCSADQNMFEVSVIDTGHGIPQEIIHRLGNEKISYGKENQSELDKGSGNGIALYNAKNDIQQVGGKLIITSKAGFGTKISIRFSI